MPDTLTEARRAAFEPDAERARLIDADIRAKLADSLDAVFGALDTQGLDLDGARVLTEQVRSGPVSPAVFALYADLVEAVMADDAVEAAGLAAELPAFAERAASGLRVVTFNEAELGPGQPERYARLVDDEGLGFALLPLTEARRANFEGLVGDTLALLDAAAPELAGEVRAYAREIVAVRGGDGSDAPMFGGASSLYLWGALVLNAELAPDRLSVAVALAHECGHTHLFGAAEGEPLTVNEEGQRLASPLRSEPRPVEGVVHAAYVLARMCWCLRRLLDSGLLTSAEAAAAEAELAGHRADFARTLPMIEEHARFTPLGRAIFGDARGWVGTLPG